MQGKVAKRGPLSRQIDELEKKYRWKAETIVRFFSGLGMTERQKVDFLAREFAMIHCVRSLRLDEAVAMKPPAADGSTKPLETTGGPADERTR